MDILIICTTYVEQFTDNKDLLQWFQSYSCTFSEYPSPTMLSVDVLHVTPKGFAKDMGHEDCAADAHTVYSPPG